MQDHTHAVSATLLFTPRPGSDIRSVLDGIASALNDTGKALDEPASLILAISERHAGSTENEIARLNGTVTKEPWVLLAGDPRGGFGVFGPFADQASCEDYPAGWENTDHWPMRLTPPADWRTPTA